MWRESLAALMPDRRRFVAVKDSNDLLSGLADGFSALTGTCALRINRANHMFVTMERFVSATRPMDEFDPWRASLVHDGLNDKWFPWKPDEYREHYRKYAHPHPEGVIEWDGLLLDGWKEPEP